MGSDPHQRPSLFLELDFDLARLKNHLGPPMKFQIAQNSRFFSYFPVISPQGVPWWQVGVLRTPPPTKSIFRIPFLPGPPPKWPKSRLPWRWGNFFGRFVAYRPSNPFHLTQISIVPPWVGCPGSETRDLARDSRFSYAPGRTVYCRWPCRPRYKIFKCRNVACFLFVFLP